MTHNHVNPTNVVRGPYEDARKDIALASAIAATLLVSPLAGSDATSEAWTAYENAKSTADLRRVAVLVS